MSRGESAAASLLSKYGCESPPVDVGAIAEGEGLQIVYHELEDSVSGMLVRHQDLATIAINVRHHENRQRFTLAHELGHFQLHKDLPDVFVDDYMVHFRADAPSLDLREAEANEFAAALLMPQSMLKRDLNDGPIDALDEDAVKVLAQRYRVSVQALTIRLVRLDFVTRDKAH